jgi:F-type H+-transporting ATPase subunit epsilon
VKLLITTPLEVAVETEDLVHVRAEDASGTFGLQPRHAALVTALVVTVVTWRQRDGSERHCAVRGGVLSVSGDVVSIATREAVVGTDLLQLEGEVLARFRHASEQTALARVDTERMRAAAIRIIQRFLRPSSGLSEGGAP